jgi:hypothetical protein
VIRAGSTRLSAEAVALAGITLVVAVARLVAAGRVGFGDSEALYASYALHPQPAYLDHPGLVGVLARTIGGGTSPTPEQAHRVATLLAALVPWAIAATAVACGASSGRALAAAIVVAVVPEIAVGLFALTPDLPLALAWTCALGCAAAALRAPPGSVRATVGFAGAGLLAAVAVASKASGVLLVGALVATYASKAARAHARTVAPWAGLLLCAVVAAPIALFEARSGWPMLRHRLLETQGDAGLALRNLGALLGGQLAYLSPGVALIAGGAAVTAWRGRQGGAVDALLFFTFATPAAVLVPLCLWSRVAEPHWIAPALLALAPAAARSTRGPSRTSVWASAGTSAALVAAVYAWVLAPGAPALAPSSYDARVDIANELYGWPDAIRAVRSAVAEAPSSSFGDVVVVGPHWVICAQVEAALRREVPVGCNTPVPDDFDTWWPRRSWIDADTIVWVTDTRFGPPPPLPHHAPLVTRDVSIRRGGRVVRTFTVTTLGRRAQA